MFEAEFWVAVATVLFVLVLLYMGVHTRVLTALDSRRLGIEGELAEARRLKEEAMALVEEYRRKRHEAEGEAQALIEAARADAERHAAEAKARMEDFVARRTKMAEAKIAQAEAQALADVRAAAADAAVAAATDILTHSTKGAIAEALIEKGIGDVKARLN